MTDGEQPDPPGLGGLGDQVTAGETDEAFRSDWLLRGERVGESMRERRHSVFTKQLAHLVGGRDGMEIGCIWVDRRCSAIFTFSRSIILSATLLTKREMKTWWWL